MDAGVDANAAAAADRVGLPAFFVAGLGAVAEHGIHAKNLAVFAGGEHFLQVLYVFQKTVVEPHEDAASGLFGGGDERFGLGDHTAQRLFDEHKRCNWENFGKQFDGGVVRRGNDRGIVFAAERGG